MPIDDSGDRISGILLGTALGDALGLPCEGLSARTIARRFGPVERFRLLGRTGFVSDDTEQSALIAQSLARHPDDVAACVRAFRRSLLGWFCRLPFGLGFGTVRACVRIGLGFSPSGVMSAGNGAAMRSGIIGAFFCNHPGERRKFGQALAEVTHRDDRAVEGALYVAEVAAACVLAPGRLSPESLQGETRRVVKDVQLGNALDRAVGLAARHASLTEATEICGTTGFVVHTVPFALFCLLRFGDDPLQALTKAISAGGDTDSVAAILGGWLGALHGAGRLPGNLIDRIHDGPFGPSHLRALAACLALLRAGETCHVPEYSRAGALVRNLALYPVVLAHGLRRIVPF